MRARTASTSSSTRRRTTSSARSSTSSARDVNPAGVLAEVVPRAFAVDWPFQATARTGPPPATLEALARFRAPLEVAADLELGTTWESVLDCWTRLADPSRPG